jgi:hypothetical protein
MVPLPGETHGLNQPSCANSLSETIPHTVTIPTINYEASQSASVVTPRDGDCVNSLVVSAQYPAPSSPVTKDSSQDSSDGKSHLHVFRLWSTFIVLIQSKRFFKLTILLHLNFQPVSPLRSMHPQAPTPRNHPMGARDSTNSSDAFTICFSLNRGLVLLSGAVVS